MKQLYNDNLQKLPNEYGDISVMDKIWRKSFEVYDTDIPAEEVLQLNLYNGH